MPAKTREEWLLRAARDLAKKTINPHLAEPMDLDKVAVSCGIPKGKASHIGQCFGDTFTEDGTQHIFICPTLGGEELKDKVRVLDVLLHELIHAAVGTKEGHRGEFARVAKATGLKGKMTATFAEEDTDLFNDLADLAKRLGDYPHSVMKRKKGGATKPPAGAWVKFCSKSAPDYILRVSPKSLEEYGPPCDFDGVEMIEDDGDSRKNRG